MTTNAPRPPRRGGWGCTTAVVILALPAAALSVWVNGASDRRQQEQEEQHRVGNFTVELELEGVAMASESGACGIAINDHPGLHVGGEFWAAQARTGRNYRGAIDTAQLEDGRCTVVASVDVWVESHKSVYLSLAGISTFVSVGAGELGDLQEGGRLAMYGTVAADTIVPEQAIDVDRMVPLAPRQ